MNGCEIELDEHDSPAHWCSNPERHAEKMGKTVEEMQIRKEAHIKASQDLQKYIATLPADQGRRKHQLVCQHRYKHGKHPFVCSKCWSYQPICLCGQVVDKSQKLELPERVHNILLWTHHREWGSISNSGSLLPILLPNTELFMKGLQQHDDEMETVFSQKNPHKVVVLWPDNDTSLGNKGEGKVPDNQRITWQELQEEKGPITLLALEGTWRTTRRMAAKLPPGAFKVALPHDIVFWKSRGEKSVLNPLRRQKGEEFSKDNLCTAEAIAAALVGLGMSRQDGQTILDLVAKKVDLTRRYQGKPLSSF
jgi:DTW domain-containing protein YfiP